MSTIDHKAMDEAAIERSAERQMDRLDRRFMAGEINFGEYNDKVAEIDWWAKNELRKAKYRYV